MCSHFIAYPAHPKTIGESIEAGVKKLRKFSKRARLETWRELDIAGHFISAEVLAKIEQKDAFIADISVLNFNVTYEVGYAIGKKKRLLLIRQKQIKEGEQEIRELGIYDTLGWKEYENADELVEVINASSSEKPLEFNPSQINRKAPVYLLDAKFKTDPIVRIKSRIKKAALFFRSFDPDETSRMSAHDAIHSVAESVGVLVPLITKQEKGAKFHNLRASFLAGLAEGMGKELSILQLGDDPVPVDYRDLVTVCKHEEQINEAIADFAIKITLAFQSGAPPVVREPKSFLERLTLGASAAENEFRDLSAYYLETDAFSRAYRGEVRVVLGRKGSGKTALFAQLRDRLRVNKKCIVVDLKPEGYKLLKFKESVLALLQEGTLEHTIMAIWEYTLLLEITYKILEKDEKPHMRNHDLFAPYRELHDLYHTDDYVSEGDFSERLAKLLEEIGGDFKAKYGTEGATRLSTAQVTELIHKHNIRKLRDSLKKYLNFKEGVWILIDNIDKGWPTHGIQQEDLVIIKTLLEATAKLERQISTQEYDCNTIVFLRNDVYELLVEATSDRGKETTEVLDWTDADALRELLRRRIVYNGLPENTEFQKVWNDIVVSHIEGEESSQYLIDRCLMRPRELLNCINKCRGFSVNRGHSRIEKQDIDDGLKIYSRDLVEEISLEIRDIFPKVDNALYLFIGEKKYLEHDDLTLLFMEHDVPEEAWSRLVELFLWYGVLGFVRPDEEPVYIYSTSYDMKILTGIGKKIANRKTVYRLNPAFWPALDIH